MYGLNHQFSSQEPHHYIFQLKSLNTIELSLRKTINKRFSCKIHFRTPRPKPCLQSPINTPLAQVLEDERESVREKFTPSKAAHKDMKILSTASKVGKESQMDSPQAKFTPKGKIIFKEKGSSAKSRFGMKLHYYYPINQRV